MAFAEIFAKGGTENVCIINTRVGLAQGFEAPDWMDLRCGWFLSLTQASADDTITGLTEEVGTPPRPFLPWTDYYAIGLTDKATGSVFLGYTNANRFLAPGRRSIGTSKLVSSDAGVGTTNTNFWRPRNEISNNLNAQILDSEVTLDYNTVGVQQHFVQSVAGAGGYALLSMLRFTRSQPTSNLIRMEIKQGTNSSDILYTSTPDADLLQQNLEAFPTTVQTLGPVELSHVPDAFYLYWPFTLSRLRIHCMGFVRQA